jgi:hypothetical protein
VDATVARNIAHCSHAGQRDRHGVPMSEHVERIGAAVPDAARAVAFLHDVLERSPTGRSELVARGLTPLQGAALDLLTRSAGESYDLHVLRIAAARGAAGRLARIVKVADLDDRIRSRYQMGDPPFAWAPQRIVIAQERLGERPSACQGWAVTTAVGQ